MPLERKVNRVTNLKNKMSKKQKSLAVVLLLSIICLSSFGVASWYLGYDSSITGFIIQSEAVTFGDDFGMTEINTNSAGASKLENLTIDNPDGAVNLTLTIVEDIIDVADLCDNEGDVTFEIEYLGQPVADGEVITIVSGESGFGVTTTAIQSSCPQEAGVKLILS